jgi:hypothetical protein
MRNAKRALAVAATFSDQRAIGSAVQACVDRGGHPTGLHFGITL